MITLRKDIFEKFKSEMKRFDENGRPQIFSDKKWQNVIYDDEQKHPVKKDAKIEVVNLYLYHVLAYVNEAEVINKIGVSEAPSEKLMRMIEDAGGITEEESPQFRKMVAEQIPLHSMDLLFKKLDLVFDRFKTSDEMCHWLDFYPNTLSLYC